MFKKLLLALTFSLIANSAFAVCSAIPLPIADFAGTSRSMSTATAADGNCKTYIDADTSSQLHTDITAATPAGTNIIGKVGIDQTTPGTTNGVTLPSQYPFGAVPITASATGTTAATTATLAASASIKTYICGFSIRANATAAATANSTVTGTVTGTLNYTQWTAPLASGLGITEQVFAPCIPSSAINTAIAVVSAAPGAGGVVSVSAWGYQL